MLEMFVSRVDDGIRRFSGDVALDELEDLAGWEGGFSSNDVHADILPPLNA
jgi:hypothetical protein